MKISFFQKNILLDVKKKKKKKLIDSPIVSFTSK